MESNSRYTLAAHDICFTTALHTKFFSLGRCIPCVRGTGVFQQGVDHCIDMLNENGFAFCNYFGELTNNFQLGSHLSRGQSHARSHQNKGLIVALILQFKFQIQWGIGRMIAEPRVPPILLPIWTHGMQNIWSERKAIWPHYFPRIGQVFYYFCLIYKIIFRLSRFLSAPRWTLPFGSPIRRPQRRMKRSEGSDWPIWSRPNCLNSVTGWRRKWPAGGDDHHLDGHNQPARIPNTSPVDLMKML